MSAQGWQFAVFPGGQPGRGGPPPGRDYQELWFRLARIPWASLVLVPADSGTSVAEIATSLAEVGTSLRDTPVTAIVADTIDYESARALSEMQPRLTNGSAYRATVNVEADAVDPEPREAPGPHAPGAHSAGSPTAGSRAAGSRSRADGSPAATPLPPSGRAIISINAVVDEPLGIAIAQAADAVLLCVEMGRSRIGAARRTIELIGQERMIGALVIRR
jgi:hypothetical protein